MSLVADGQCRVRFSESFYDMRRELGQKTGHKNLDNGLKDTKNLYRTEEICGWRDVLSFCRSTSAGEAVESSVGRKTAFYPRIKVTNQILVEHEGYLCD